MINQTIEKFGYPKTLLTEYDHWLLLLRPAQVTAGSLILAAKGPSENFSDLSDDAFSEQKKIISDIEGMLRGKVKYDRINYLMLMMVDPNVHFHVIPRYSGVRSLAGVEFSDAGWPGPPDLPSAIALSDDQISAAIAELRTV